MAKLNELIDSTPPEEVVGPVLEGDLVYPDGKSYIHQDILDAISLLSKCRRLLGYVAHKDLCKTISKKERDLMEGVYVQVGDWLRAVDEIYQ